MLGITRKARGISIPLAVLIGVCLSVGVTSPAHADDTISVTWVDSSSVTVEYGEPWSLSVQAQPFYNYSCGTFDCPPTLSMTIDGVVRGDLGMYSSSAGIGVGTLYTPDAEPPLAVGSHELVAYVNNGGATGHTPTAATLTITKTPLTVDLRVTTDPNRSTNAIVTGALTGRFIDSVQPDYQKGSSPQYPAGTWQLTITDSSGKTAFSTTADHAAGALPSIAVLWKSVPRDEVFTASGTFTPAASASGNFGITNATDVSYTSAGATSEPGGVPTATPSPEVIESTSSSVPLWAVLLAVLAAAALIASTIVMVLRFRSSGTTASQPVSIDTPAEA
jgi:hypothetical protein